MVIESAFKVTRYGHFLFFFKLGYSCFTMLCQFLMYSEVELPVLYSRLLLVIYFIHISVYMSIPISQFIPFPTPCFPPLVSIPLFSTSVPLFLQCISSNIAIPQMVHYRNRASDHTLIFHFSACILVSHKANEFLPKP